MPIYNSIFILSHFSLVFTMFPKTWFLMATLYVIMNSFSLVEPFPESDKILKLPGQQEVNFNQFSGYISVDEEQQRFLFYYFVEADNNSASKPLVLWLNGGPGCSSMIGAFVEHGPFKANVNTLVKNDFSWNKEANMLYLESPAGVGFSYSADASFYDLVNDEITARDNLAFLENWFEKFPEYKNRDFYITGESYAGHYVPQLANLIVQSRVQINLKGIAIGNPLLEFNTDFNLVGEYLWSHGLISDDSYNLLNIVCNYSQIRRQWVSGKYTPECNRTRDQMYGEIGEFVDAYDVTLDVCLPSISSQAQLLSQVDKKNGIDVCLMDEMYSYLNREDVHRALHARLVGVANWTICSRVLNYDLQNLEIPTIHLLVSLVKSEVRVLVFSGDQDSVLPLMGTRQLVSGLAKELCLNTTSPYRAWFQGRQVGGWTQAYGDCLSFATIRGAAHEAPFTQPERSLVLFKAFLDGNPLPQVSSNLNK